VSLLGPALGRPWLRRRNARLLRDAGRPVDKAGYIWMRNGAGKPVDEL
jgi:hypothetical protein